MYTIPPRRAWAGLWSALLIAPAGAATLHEAFEAAWLLQPEAQATAARQSELDARRQAADALLPETPVAPADAERLLKLFELQE